MAFLVQDYLFKGEVLLFLSCATNLQNEITSNVLQVARFLKAVSHIGYTFNFILLFI